MRRILLLLLIMIALTACSSPAAPTAVPTVAPISAPIAASNAPDWVSIPFTDARTNQPITLANFAGKTVYIEAMAVWCTNCLAQQTQVIQARKSFGDDVVFISLDVDPSEDIPKIAKYATDKGFDWTFTQASKELTAKLIDQFGRTITNPSSVPIFIISPNGKVSELFNGIHSADDLVTLIKQHQSAA